MIGPQSEAIGPQSKARLLSAMPSPLATLMAHSRALLACIAISAALVAPARAQDTNRLDEYRAALDKLETIETYNDQMERLVAAQKDELEALNAQIERAGTIERELVPLMFRMIETLDEFVALDLPFLADERRKRVETLKSAMGRPDISPAEKYRRILEAYQVESEYGRTIGAYQAAVDTEDGEKRTVDILRIGRVALLYRTLDGEHAAMWDGTSRSWIGIDGTYLSAVERGLRMARKQAPLDMLVLPVRLPAEETEGTE